MFECSNECRWCRVVDTIKRWYLKCRHLFSTNAQSNISGGMMHIVFFFLLLFLFVTERELKFFKIFKSQLICVDARKVGEFSECLCLCCLLWGVWSGAL